MRQLGGCGHVFAQQIQPRTGKEAELARRATRIAVTTWAIMLAVPLGMMLFDYLASSIGPVAAAYRTRARTAELPYEPEGTKPTMRSGPPLPPSIFIGRATTKLPEGGSRSRFVTFSKPATLSE